MEAESVAVPSANTVSVECEVLYMCLAVHGATVQCMAGIHGIHSCCVEYVPYSHCQNTVQSFHSDNASALATHGPYHLAG